MKKLTPWISGDGCAYRLLSGAEDKPYNRIAFIERTPRVKLVAGSYSVSIDETDMAARSANVNGWICGPSGNGPDDLESRDWCDSMLNLLGYEDEPPIPKRLSKNELKNFRNKYLFRG